LRSRGDEVGDELKQQRQYPVKDNDIGRSNARRSLTISNARWKATIIPADEVHNSPRQAALLVRYDLAGVKKLLTKTCSRQRPADLWRYREMLPVRKVADISARRSPTPLIRAKLAKKIGGGEIIVKDEGRLRPVRSRRVAWSWRCRWVRRSPSSTCDADQRQCRAALGCLCHQLRHQDHDLLSRRHA